MVFSLIRATASIKEMETATTLHANFVLLLTKMNVDPTAANFSRMGEFLTLILCKKHV